MSGLDTRISSGASIGPRRVPPKNTARTALAALALGGILAGCDDDRPATSAPVGAPTAEPAPVMTPMTQAAVTAISDDQIGRRFDAEERDPILRATNNLDRDIAQYNRALGEIGAVLHQFDSYYTSEAYSRMLSEFGNTPKVPGARSYRVSFNAAKDPNRYRDIVGGNSINSFGSAQGEVYPLRNSRFRECVEAFFATEPSFSTDRVRWQEYDQQRFNLSLGLLRVNDALTQIKDHVQVLQVLLSQGNARISANTREEYAQTVLFLNKVVHDYAPVFEAWKQMVDNHRPAYFR